MLLVEIITFGFAWWLGLYLLRRRTDQPAILWTAAGLILYAVVLMVRSLEPFFAVETTISSQVFIALFLLPCLCWLMALRDLWPQIKSIGIRWRSAENPGTAVGLILFTTIALFLGFSLFLIPLEWLPHNLVTLAIGGDLLILGYAVGVLDAFNQGESLLPDIKRSLLGTEILTYFFGIQIGLLMWLSTGITLGTLALLYVVTASATIVAVYASDLQAALDGFVFGRDSSLQQERATLREMGDALPRAESAETTYSEEDFAKLVRRALSNMGNLPKLATSPLVQMPLVTIRLREKGLDDTIMHRSAELKLILADAIGKLKPADDQDFNDTEAWRHFNALYFPYVRGLRPYSRRPDTSTLSPADKKALGWFQREIPARTLYNWQTAAAKLIAADLDEQRLQNG